jgi:hypothetical protein
MDLGKETTGAFSNRIQRKLSIAVPPRPMVTVDPKEAAASMKIILDNLMEIEGLYEYNSPHEIIVSHTLPIILTGEFLSLLCGSRTRSIRLHSVNVAGMLHLDL